MTISNRLFTVMGFDHNEPLDYKTSANDLFRKEENPDEVKITLQQQIDAILDLKVGETIQVKTARDHEHSIGVCMRIR